MIRLSRLSAGIASASLALAIVLLMRLGAGWTAKTMAALAVMLLGQTTSLVACAFALRAASARKINLVDAAHSRWIRDAVANLCAGTPGVGEAAGARALVLRSLPITMSTVATAVDLAGETLAQGLYILAVLPFAPKGAWPRVALPEAGGATGVALIAAAVVAMAAWRLRRERWRKWLAPRVVALIGHARSLDVGACLSCTGWHLFAWLIGGLQVWGALHLLDAAPALRAALALEALIYLARAAAFVVPAGVGVQEAVVIGAAAPFHIPWDAALTLAVLLRARDVLFGAPALTVWVRVELVQLRGRLGARAARRRRGAPRAALGGRAVSPKPSNDPAFATRAAVAPTRLCDFQRGTSRPWFGRKRDGRGVTPKSLAGWAAVLSVAALGSLFSALPHLGWATRDSLVLLTVAAFVLTVICKWEA